jgi:hypothetical protein
MISAKEARELWNASDAKVEKFLLKTVEPAIVKAAKDGNREVKIHIGCHSHKTPYNILDLDTNVLAKLQNLGYTAGIEWIDAAYVPRGLQNEIGEGPLHRNYGYFIRW